jgi:hypothetical protein
LNDGEEIEMKIRAYYRGSPTNDLEVLVGLDVSTGLPFTLPIRKEDNFAGPNFEEVQNTNGGFDYNLVW